MAILDNLISYWDLGEASGSAIDIHGDNDLTDNNTVGTGTGKIGNARDFEKDSSECLSCASNASLTTGDIDFSFSLWVKYESLPDNYPYLVAKRGSGSTHEYYLYRSNDGSNIFTFLINKEGVGNVGSVNFNLTISTGTWYHIVCWHDSVANQVGLTVDNATPVTAATSDVPSSNSSTFFIGAGSASAGFTDGLIDEVGFWKRVLTSQERADLYNGGAGLAYPLTVASGKPTHQMHYARLRSV